MFSRSLKSISSEWMWQRDCKHRKAEPEAAGILRGKATKRSRE